MQTDVPSNVGLYHISIIGSVSNVFMNPSYEEELIIVLTVSNECLLDDVSSSDTISN